MVWRLLVLVCCSGSGVFGALGCGWFVLVAYLLGLFLYWCFIALIVLLPFLRFFFGWFNCLLVWLLWLDACLRCLCGVVWYSVSGLLVCGCCRLFGCLLPVSCALDGLVCLRAVL